MNYDATLTLPSPGSSGSLSANKAIIIDNTAPTSHSISINNGDNSTFSTSVTLTLSATDAVGVTGYYSSESSTTPLVSTSGWSSVTSSTSLSDNVSFTLSSAIEDKTVYVWFKDAAGNVSTSASDNITFSPTIVISRTGTAWNGSTYTSSNLEWQIATGGEEIWDTATSYCNDLELASKTDWRLPTRDELGSLIDLSQTPVIVSSLTATTLGQNYRTSTVNASHSAHAWYVDFKWGNVDSNL